VNGRKKGGSGFGVVRTVVLAVALGVLAFSGWQLFQIFHVYRESGKEYARLADSYTAPAESIPAVSDGTSPGTPAQTPPYPDIEDAEPPLTVDWNKLKSINPEIVGWLYIDAQPKISYPICQAKDNDYYLHRTFERQDLFAGAIFMDFHNASDFSDPDSIVYGHNMKNGSMFGMLKYVADQYEEHPYFWILTPEGNYRYHIYSIMSTAAESDVYTLYSGGDDSFLAWEKKLQAGSEVKNELPLYKTDKTVILSTCTSDSNVRKVVIGKCVSSVRPEKKTTPAPTPSAAPSDGVYEGDDAAGQTG